MTFPRKLTYYPILFLFLLPAKFQAQTTDMARSGPNGNFIFLGKNVPSGKIISQFIVERRLKGADWKQLAEVKAPVSFTEFNSRLDAAKSILPVQPLPTGAMLEEMFRQATQWGTTDSIKSWRNEYPLRLALGLMYYDADVKPGNEYQYRVTGVNNAAMRQNIYTSNVVQFPYSPGWDTILPAAHSYKDNKLYIRWRSIGNSPAPLFMVLKFVNQKPVLASGKTIRYTIHDTTSYVYADSLLIPAGEKPQYFLSPYDNFGNPGRPTSVVVINKDDLSQAFFTHTKASKTGNMLGVKLSWNLSRPDAARSIDVFRSTRPDKDFTLLVTLTANDSSYLDERIVPDKVYYYQLRANSSYGGQPTQSNTFFAVGYDPAVPLAPAIVAAIGIKGGVKLFIDVTDARAAGIRLYRNNGIGDTLLPVSTLLRKTEGARIVFTDTSSNLSGRRTYTYAARTESTSYILSELSVKVTARPLITTPPPAPSFVKIYTEDGVVKLSWENMQVTDPVIAGYVVSRGIVKGTKDAKTELTPIVGTTSPYTRNFLVDSTALAGNTYTYEIQAVDIDNNRGVLKTRSTVALPDNLPISPGSISLMNVKEGVHVEWAETAYKGLQSYKLYRYQRGFEPSVVSVLPASAAEYTDMSALPGELYFYFLTTVNNLGKESARSEEAGIMH